MEVDQISFSRNEINMTMIISLYCEGRERGGGTHEHTICTSAPLGMCKNKRVHAAELVCACLLFTSPSQRVSCHNKQPGVVIAW